jgi:hypothetical protein
VRKRDHKSGDWSPLLGANTMEGRAPIYIEIINRKREWGEMSKAKNTAKQYANKSWKSFGKTLRRKVSFAKRLSPGITTH